MWSKHIVVGLSFVLTSTHLFAETKLACWNNYAPRGSKPVMTADIGTGNVLSNIKLDKKDELLETYQWERRTVNANSFENYEWSAIIDPIGEHTPVLNTSRRSPYQGNNSYAMKVGRWKSRHYYGDQSVPENTRGDVEAQLYLPTDLSSEALKNYRIRAPSERSNAVMMINPPYFSHQGGKNYLRMFCTSK